MPSVHLLPLLHADAEEQAFARRAVTTLQDVLNDPIFLQQVRQATFSSSRFQTDDGSYREATNEEIAQLIEQGKEYLKPADGVVNLQVRLKRLWSRKVVGGVTPPNPEITTNTRFFDQWLAQGDALSVAAHWFHEWLHVAGLRHASSNSDYSDATYQIRNLVVTVGQGQAQAALAATAAPASVAGQGYLNAVQQGYLH